ncbi:MAG: GHKL domain-containing protein [Eubacteriales bacterium]
MKVIIIKALSAITILTLIVLLVHAAYEPSIPNEIVTVDQWSVTIDNQVSQITLPDTIDIEEPRTPVTLETTISSTEGSYIYFKSVYAPVKIYMNDTLVYGNGFDTTDSIFLDPPTIVSLLEIPSSMEKTINLRFEFLSPTQRDSLSLSPVLLGSSYDIYSYLFQSMGMTLVFGGLLVTLEIFLILIGILVIRIPHASAPFFWLGLFAVNISAWTVCECNLTELFMQNASMLYVISYIALFILMYPLIQFVQVTLNLRHKKPLQILSYGIALFTCIGIYLQLTSTMDLAKLLYVSQGLNLFTLCFLTVMILLDYFRYQNQLVKSYLLPFFNFLIFGCLEIANYHLDFLRFSNSFFLQIAIFLFILYSTVILKTTIQDTLKTQLQNVQLSSELAMLTNQINHQKERYALMAEHTSILRRQRHDLRHQLSVIRRYNDLHETEKINDYLNELTQNIPTNTDINFCQNDVMNSVILYYYSMAKECNISTIDVHIQIPEDIGQIHESDLCIVVGNLLENAIHACKDLENPYIKIYGKKVQDFITISVENPCTVVKRNLSGTFRTTKKSSGIGLMSIESVVKKYNGTTKFDEKDGVFSSFIYLFTK